MKLRRREVVAGLAAALALPTAAHARARRLPMPDVALWDPPLAFAEGHVRGPNGRIYYRRYRGRAAKAPLIVLHGGPAAGHRRVSRRRTPSSRKCGSTIPIAATAMRTADTWRSAFRGRMRAYGTAG